MKHTNDMINDVGLIVLQVIEKIKSTDVHWYLYYCHFSTTQVKGWWYGYLGRSLYIQRINAIFKATNRKGY